MASHLENFDEKMGVERLAHPFARSKQTGNSCPAYFYRALFTKIKRPMKKQFILIWLGIFSAAFAIAQSNGKWIPLGNDLLSSDYTTYDISASGENVVWSLLCKGGYFNDPFDCKVIRSTDGGKTWKVIDLNTKIASNAYAVGIFALNDSTAWLTVGILSPSQRRIYKTSDGGENWSVQYAVTAPSGRTWPPAVQFVNSQKGYFIDVFGNASGKTEDGGVTWKTSSPLTLSGSWIWGQVAQKNWWDVKGDTIWWGTSQFILKSTNGGTSWKSFFPSFPDQNTIQSVKFAPNGAGLATSDVKNVNGFGGIVETVLLQSQNFGETWSRLPNFTSPLSVITYVPGTEKTFVGVSGSWYPFNFQTGKYVSAITQDGGISWKLIDQGIARNAVEFTSPSTGWAGRMEKFAYGAGNPAIFKWEGDLTTQTIDIFHDNHLQANPNPFTAETRLEFDLIDATLPVALEVADVTGKVLHAEVFDKLNPGLNQIPLRFNAPRGILLVTLKQGQGVQTIKVVKN